MKILITSEGQYINSDTELPEVGKKYTLTDATDQSEQQRKAWHALVHEWYKSGCYSFVDTLDFNVFREAVKELYGEGFSHYEYIDSNYKTCKAKTLEEIPDDIILDTRYHPDRIHRVLKHFYDYTKNQVKKSLDVIIPAMDENEVDTPKYHEIIKGMQNDSEAEVRS